MGVEKTYPEIAKAQERLDQQRSTRRNTSSVEEPADGTRETRFVIEKDTLEKVVEAIVSRIDREVVEAGDESPYRAFYSNSLLSLCVSPLLTIVSSPL